MKCSRVVGVLAGLFVLSACGGGGGSGSGNSGPISGGGTPTPTPSTSPTPSPTYSTYSALTGNREFALACMGLELDGNQAFPAQPVAFGMDTQTLLYNAADDIWTVAGEVQQDFGPADAVPPTNPQVEELYRITTPSAPAKTLIIAAPRPGGSTSQYTRVLYYQLPNLGLNTTEVRNCVFGVPTLPSDVPSASQVSYNAFELTGSVRRQFDDFSFASYSLAASNISVSVNLSAYTVSISMNVTGTLVSKSSSGTGSTAPVTIDLGTLNATDVEINDAPYAIGGLFNYQDFSKQIPFEGWFFGPQGKEIGFAITYASNDPDINNTAWGTTGTMVLTASR